MTATKSGEQEIKQQVEKITKISDDFKQRMDVFNLEITNISATVEEVTAKCQEIAATAAMLVTEESKPLSV